MDLTDRDRAILDFERGWWSQPGSKEDAIKARLDLSATRYYELLSGLVDSSEAEAYDPLVVRRLRRDRSVRRRGRFVGPSAGGADSPMSIRDRGSGGFMSDGSTNTVLAAIIIVVAVVVSVVLLHHSGSTKAVTISTTSSGSTTTIIPGGGTSATTQPGSTPTSAGGSTTSTSTGSPPTTTVAPADIKVLVLNGASFSEPLASTYTAKVKALGYQTLTPNNASGTVKASIIYVMTAGYAPEGDALATALGLTSSAVETTLTTEPPLSPGTAATGANLVLVVGPDLAAKS